MQDEAHRTRPYQPLQVSPEGANCQQPGEGTR